MAELQQRLAERRRNADALSTEYNSSDFREVDGNDAGRLSIGGKEAQQVQAFRSGWTSNPKFHDWEKPKQGWEAPALTRPSAGKDSPRKIAEKVASPQLKMRLGRSDVPSGSEIERVLQNAQAEEKRKAEENASSVVQASAAIMAQDAAQARAVRDAIAIAAREADSGKQARVEVTRLRVAAEKEQEKQVLQKERLDKVLAFALAEKSKLERLIEEAHSDSSQQTDQLQKLMASKAAADRMLSETKESLSTVQGSLATVEADRDAARNEVAQIAVERTDLQGLVASVQEENRRLEEVVTDLSVEKETLQAVVERASLIEDKLAEAQAVSAEFEKKAERVEKLEALLVVAEGQRVRLEQLLSETSDDQGAVLAQKAALEAKLEEVQAENEAHKEALKDREKVDRVVQLLEVENVRLVKMAEEAQTRSEELEEVVKQTSAENKKLQSQLADAQAATASLESKAVLSQSRHVELEAQIRGLEKDREELINNLEQERQAMRTEAQRSGDSSSEAATQRAELEKKVAAVEAERQELQRMVEEASQQAAVAIASKEEAALVADNRATSLEGEIRTLSSEKQVLLTDLDIERQEGAKRHSEVQSQLEAVRRDSQLTKESLEARLLAAETTAESSKALLAENQEWEEIKRGDLQRQLDEAMRDNEALQRTIEEVASPSRKASLESPREEARSSADISDPRPKEKEEKSFLEELSTTSFGSLMDNWLSVLNAAAEDPIPSSAATEKEKRPSRPRSPMIGNRGVTKRHLAR